MMKHNYLFHNRTFLARQVAGGWIILLMSIIVFALVAATIAQVSTNEAVTIGLAFFITAPLVVLAHWYLYRHEQERYTRQEFGRYLFSLPPEQRVPAATKKLQEIKHDLDKVYRDLTGIKARYHNLFVQVSQVRRRAREIGRWDIVKEADRIERDMQVKVTEMNVQIDRVLQARQEANIDISVLQESVTIATWLDQRRIILQQQHEQLRMQKQAETQFQQKYIRLRARV